MDTKKLDKWADMLLDTGKRNGLIQFKETRSSATAEILWPSSEVLFGKIDGTASFEVFDPKIISDPTDPGTESVQLSTEHPESTSSGKKEYLAKYSSMLRRQNQVLLYHGAGDPLVYVKKIDKRAREFQEETGVNVAYMAFGFIHWTESSTSSVEYRAPVLLVPIHLHQDSSVDPYYIQSDEDDMIVNPTFSYKLEAEFGVKLPPYQEEGLLPYLEKVRKIVSKLQWTVSSECKIGIFSFLKINMYHDLKEHADLILRNHNVRNLLGESMSEAGPESTPEDPSHTGNPLIDLHSVVDADSSQIEAIEMAKSGKSFVLQGPPGTGKSQTITNIIAECLSDGKKVLFVSEKLAALNVVYQKLKQAGLSEFCLELHSHKANKKDVIADIYHTLKIPPRVVTSRADEEISVKERAQRKLDSYATELHRRRSVINLSLYQLYERYAAFRSAPDIAWTVPHLSGKGDSYLAETSGLLQQYAEYVVSIGYDYRKNPWYGCILQDISYQAKDSLHASLSAVQSFLQQYTPLTRDISGQYGLTCVSLSSAEFLSEILQFFSKSELITPSLLQKDRFDSVKEVLLQLQSKSEMLRSLKTELEHTCDPGIYEVNGREFHRILIQQFSGTFSRMLNAEYKQIIKQLRLFLRDGHKPSYEDAVSICKKLAEYEDCCAEYTALENTVKPFLGRAYQGPDSDWDSITAQLNLLAHIFSGPFSLDGIADHLSDPEGIRQLASDADKLCSLLGSFPADQIEHLAGCFDPSAFNITAAPGIAALEKCTSCLEAWDLLDNWCHFRNLLSELTDHEVRTFIDAAISQNIEVKDIVSAFHKLFYNQWIDSIISRNSVFSMFSRISQENSVHTFAEKDREQFEINKAKIRAELSSQRPSSEMIAAGSAVAQLLREGEKKRKQKSIRVLLQDCAEVIQRVKPCFLMSPLSVSTFLDPEAVHFDVVVFDEASQIFPQDAIGAIYRADQAIIVGDSKQMPPSNFFNSRLEDTDSDEETGDVADFESILDLCSATMQQLRLRWHYRSRYEQLIAFSNKNFYDNDLVTFPSSHADTQGVGVDYYHVDGLFDRKSHTNRREAEYVVDLIYKNLAQHPERSLGVVAFSASQQDLIDKLLMQRRQANPDKEFYFLGTQTEPLFIKNLETVQGDERDTIIFSVAYGFDAQGRLLHQFGPLNSSGGERRLNVAVTRAKCNVQLVSSMHYTDIDLKRSGAEGVKLLREYLDFAENGNIALERSLSVSPFEQFDSDFELEVCEFLRSHGYTVDTQVGCSGFRIDLALKIPDSSDYVLAIECDGATYHSSRNARDRDRLRQEILERMGWKFYRIWSTDWFRNRSVEQQHLLCAAEQALKAPGTVFHRQEPIPKCDSFETVVEKPSLEFPKYEEADIASISRRFHYRDLKAVVKEILSVEAPLSEELLLKRIVWWFDRSKVTKVVQQEYWHQMLGCEEYGIVREKGFLYLRDQTEFHFRKAGLLDRKIEQIALEELAAGLLELLKQNVTAERNGLYRTLAQYCGITRLGKTVTERMDRALYLIHDSVEIDGDQISLKVPHS